MLASSALLFFVFSDRSPPCLPLCITGAVKRRAAHAPTTPSPAPLSFPTPLAVGCLKSLLSRYCRRGNTATTAAWIAEGSAAAAPPWASSAEALPWPGCGCLRDGQGMAKATCSTGVGRKQTRYIHTCCPCRTKASRDGKRLAMGARTEAGAERSRRFRPSERYCRPRQPAWARPTCVLNRLMSHGTRGGCKAPQRSYLAAHGCGCGRGRGPSASAATPAPVVRFSKKVIQSSHLLDRNTLERTEMHSMRLKERSSQVKWTSSSRFSMARIPLLSSRSRVSRLCGGCCTVSPSIDRLVA